MTVDYLKKLLQKCYGGIAETVFDLTTNETFGVRI